MAYCTLSDVQSWLGITDSFDDPELDRAILAACNAIDTHCGYPFSLAGSATAKVFQPSNPVDLDIAAAGWTIASTSGLVIKSDDDDDGVYEVTWSASDYLLYPLNAVGPGGVAWPYTSIRATDTYTWPLNRYRAAVEITAVWGWPSVPSRVEQAAIMLAVAWHQRRQVIAGRGGFDGFFTSAIVDDSTISDLLAPFRHGQSMVGFA